MKSVLLIAVLIFTSPFCFAKASSKKSARKPANAVPIEKIQIDEVKHTNGEYNCFLNGSFSIIKNVAGVLRVSNNATIKYELLDNFNNILTSCENISKKK